MYNKKGKIGIRQDRPNRDIQRQDQLNQKSPQQWRHAAAWNRSVLPTLIYGRHLGCPVEASARDRRQGQRC